MKRLSKYLVALASVLGAYGALAENVAQVGSTTYASLQDAFNALTKDNPTLKLLTDVKLQSGVTYTPTVAQLYAYISTPEQFVVDLNGKTITIDGDYSTEYALTLNYPYATASTASAYFGMRIKNGTIRATGAAAGAIKDNAYGHVRYVGVTMSSESSENATFSVTSEGWTSVLKDCQVTNTGAGGAINMQGQMMLLNACTVTDASGTAIYVYNNKDTYGGTVIAASTVTGTTALQVSDTSHTMTYITGGRINGDITSKASKLTVCGGVYTQDPSDYIDSGFKVEENEDAGTFTLVEDGQVYVNDEEEPRDSLKSAIESAKGGTLKLANDVYVIGLEYKENLIDIAATENLTIDLNGHNLTVFDVSACFSAVHAICIKSGAKCTITDSSEEKSGRLQYRSWAADFRGIPYYANDVISNNGTLTIDSGAVEQDTVFVAKFGPAAYALDAYGGSKTTITGTGSLYNPKIDTIRTFEYAGSTIGIEMTGGEIVSGGYRGIWMQSPASTLAGQGTVNVKISGGTLKGYYAIYGSAGGGASTVVITNTPVISGYVMTTSSSVTGRTPGFFQINGGDFVNPSGSSYYIYDYSGKGCIEVTGGVFDRSYLWYDSTTRCNVIGDYRVEGDFRYHFGPHVAVLYGPCYYRSSTSASFAYYTTFSYDYYSSLTVALQERTSYYSSNKLYYYYYDNVSLLADDTNAEPCTITDGESGSVYLNGYSVTSTSEEPLITLDCYTYGTTRYTSYPSYINVYDEGSITNNAQIFKCDDTAAEVNIYAGNYTTKGTSGTLFSGNVKVIADVGDGDIYELNEASFSHDVSDFVYNSDATITMKTLQPTSERWYLGRSVKVEETLSK